jgi:hypothetical protein
VVTGREKKPKRRKKRNGKRKMNRKKRPIPDPANRKTLQMANDHRELQ